MKLLKELLKESEVQKSTILKPLSEAVSATRELFKPFETSVVTMEANVKTMMVEFVTKQQQKSEALAAKVESGKLSLKGYTKQTEDLMVTGNGDSQIRKKAYVEIEDESKIPRKYLVPDLDLIMKDLKDGKNVSGCSLKHKPQIAI